MTIYQDKLQLLEKRTKEAGETRYWLRVLAELLPDEDFGTVQQEALELNQILQKINSTMKTEKQEVMVQISDTRYHGSNLRYQIPSMSQTSNFHMFATLGFGFSLNFEVWNLKFKEGISNA